MRYVVVGAGAAGISAARTLRQLDREGDIVLVSKDDKVHSRCMLHKYLGGQRTAGRLTLRRRISLSRWALTGLQERP